MVLAHPRYNVAPTLCPPWMLQCPERSSQKHRPNGACEYVGCKDGCVCGCTQVCVKKVCVSVCVCVCVCVCEEGGGGGKWVSIHAHAIYVG